MAKITKAFVDTLKPPPKEYKISWDDTLKGFGVRITTGGKISYLAQGRVKGKVIAITIGGHGTWTPDKARLRAKELLLMMDQGTDPRVLEKTEAAAKVTLRQVADAYFRDRHLKDTSRADIERHVSKGLKSWEHKPIVSITRDMVTKRFHEYCAGGLYGMTPAPGQANQMMGALRSLFNYAIREYRRPDGSPLITDNPTDTLYKKWAPSKARTRRVPDTRVGHVWNALMTERQTPYTKDHLTSLDFVLFLMLTGTRRGEAGSLKWSNVNLDEGWFHLSDTKNGNPVWLPLSDQALAILRTRHDAKVSEYVFNTSSRLGYISQAHSAINLLSKVAGTPLSCHDLRRTFTQIAVGACGIDIYKAELLTNHRPSSVTTKHYLETQRLEYLRPEVQRVADWITGQVKLQASSTELT